MPDDRFDVCIRQRVSERGHVPIQPAHRTTLVNHREPVTERLRRGERAVGEIRQLDVEADDAAGGPAAILPVAGRTRELEDVFAGVAGRKCGGRGWRIDRLGANGDGCRPHEQRRSDDDRLLRMGTPGSHRAGTLARGSCASKTRYSISESISKCRGFYFRLK